MNHLFVEVSASVIQADAESATPQYRCVDGRNLRPGVWATIVYELSALQTDGGRALAGGFYAVLWPMGEGAPRYDEGPFYFGPFASKRAADALIGDVSARAGESIQGIESGVPKMRRHPTRQESRGAP